MGSRHTEKEATGPVGAEPGLRRWVAYGVAVASIGCALLARLLMDPALRDRQPFASFNIATAVTAWFGGVWPALVAMVLGYLTADWFFIPPRRAFNILRPAPDDWIGMTLYFIVTGTVILLTESLRRAKQRADHGAKAAHESEARLGASREQLRALAGHLQSIREEERTRIARELHDNLGQALTGLRLELSWLSGRLTRSADEGSRPLVEHARSMIELVDETVEAVRQTATELRPGVLDDLGLTAAIEWQAADFQKRTSIRCDVAANLGSPTTERDVATAIFRIVQEALTNVARHAQAARVRIALRETDGDVVVEITDDGRGITEPERSGPASLGLLGIRERAHLLGGEVTISGIPGRGTTVTARVPLGRAGSEQT